MTIGRRIGVTALVFVVAQVIAITVHGFILRADYLPMYGVLLKPMDGSGPSDPTMLLMPLAHLAFAIAFVTIYEHFQRHGGLADGLRYAAFVWLIGPVPMYFIWTAQQPWPNGLVWKQIALELAGMLVLGSIAGKLVRRPVTG